MAGGVRGEPSGTVRRLYLRLVLPIAPVPGPLPPGARRAAAAPIIGNEVLINLTPPQSKRRLRELGRL